MAKLIKSGRLLLITIFLLMGSDIVLAQERSDIISPYKLPEVVIKKVSELPGKKYIVSQKRKFFKPRYSSLWTESFVKLVTRG